MNIINRKIRKTIIRMTSRANASHVGSALSMVEILKSLYELVDLRKIKDEANDRDRIILSKGHGTASLYAVMYHYGLLSKSDIDCYCENGSLMAGHASHFINGVEHSTGALGHGLPVGLGIALGCRAKGIQNKVFVIVGDGELHEGSNWEAIMYAGHQKVSRLYLLIDKNEHSQLGETNQACNIDPLKEKFDAFNFCTKEVHDGHDEKAIKKSIIETSQSKKPVAIICNTVKGKGISFMEGNNLWHYRPPKGEDFLNAIKELE